MYKKLLALVAVAAFGYQANAEIVEDYFIDYTTTNWNFYVMGYKPNCDAGWLTVTQPFGTQDGDEFTPSTDADEDGSPDPVWYQCFVADGIPTEVGTAYTVTVYGKASEEATCALNMGWGWGDGESLGNQITFGTDWEEIEVPYGEVGGDKCNLVMQPGTQLTTFEIQWIKVSHNASAGPSQPEEWVDWLVNGDAEGEYGEYPCAYGKEYAGRGDDDKYTELASPVPAEIIDMDGSKVFVVRAKTVDTSHPYFSTDAGNGAEAWQNQFWIQSPKAWNTGDQIRISFRYKADKPASADSQAHKETPGDYLHWELLGSINFTTEWQEFSKVITLNSSQNGMWSAAFNLKESTMDNNYYFDDLKWETMKLDEGWFVAGDFNDWNYGEAIELVLNEEDGEYQGVVGTDDNPASQICISTKRGNDSAFKANCIKTTADLADGEYVDYKVGYQKINLPEAGVWKICIDEENEQIAVEVTTDALIDGMADDNVAPVYYNLQGMRVNNPANGNIYIVKRGNKVAKQIIR